MSQLIKERTRSAIKEKLKSLDASQKLDYDRKLLSNLKKLLENFSSNWTLQYGEMPTFGLYIPLQVEPDVKPVFGWKVAKASFPFNKNSEMRLMEYCRYNNDQWGSDLNHHFFQMDRPNFCIPDVILVPGLLFDRNGNRLGRGMGYFDTYLLQHSCVSIGLCYSFQLEKNIVVEEHDKKMNTIVTDNEILTITKDNFLNHKM
jgi:5-formyltetrahydrofolate cyclo-ligase